MALSPAVPVMAPGELITSSRANAVRSNLDRIDNRVTSELAAAVTALHTRQAEAGPFAQAVAGAPTDATTAATFTTWLTVNPAATTPSWATVIVIQVNIDNVQAVTADCVYALSATLNGGSYGATDWGSIGFAAANALGSAAFAVHISPIAGAGGPTVLIGARRVAGTGVMRANTSSRASVSVSFR